MEVARYALAFGRSKADVLAMTGTEVAAMSQALSELTKRK